MIRPAKYILIAILIVTLPAFRPSMTQPQPQSPEATVIDELFGVMKMTPKAEALVASMTSQYRELKGLPPGFHVLFAKYAKPADFVAMQRKIWLSELTEADLKGLLGFYRSSPGQHYLTAQPKIRRRSMVDGQSWGQKIAAQVLKELKG